MKTAIVTGASKGIGLCIVKKLISMDYTVYGISRNFILTDYTNDNFIKITCDLEDTDHLVDILKMIDKDNTKIDLLVNNAGIGFFGPQEQIGPEKIKHLLRVNLEAPIIITSCLLKKIKSSSGTIVFISSYAGKKISTHGCAYAASKAGLTHFADSLFNEVRKTGVKIITLHPDMTKTGFYDNLDFTVDDNHMSYIDPEQVADTFAFTISQNENMVITDVTIKPQIIRIKRKTQK